MAKNIGFFDVDSLESGASTEGDPIPIIPGLRFRERVYPISKKLNQLYFIARKGEHPLVFSTCCAGKFLKQDERDDTLFVRFDESRRGWLDRIHDSKMVYLEKFTTCDLNKYFDLECHLLFKHNPNVKEYFRISKINHWVIFGSGFELCISTAIKNILALGKKVWLIQDCITQTPKCDSNTGTQESLNAGLRELEESGVKLVILDEFKEWYYKLEL